MSTAATPAVPAARAAAGGVVVAAHGLERRFGEGPTAVPALRGVDLAVRRGTFTAIMGPSGSGKSTLLHLLAGLDRPTAGDVEIAGVALSGLDDRRLTLLRREQVGFVFQAYNLLPTLTAEQNVVLPLRIGHRPVDRAWVDELLRAVGLEDRRDHRPGELSGGQQQRVAVARALVTRPAIVFGDEPTGNLDSVSSRELLDLLRRAVDELDQTIVMVTHDPVAACRADRVVFLADGRIAAERERPGLDDVLGLLRDLARP
jgi:putative ABC transport system ATP-binding protein